jgi:beta-galactosidase
MQAIAHGADTVQYFQFRKGRGASEKFHGAVVDHEGTEKTRVFRDVAAVGKRLKGMDAIAGASTPAKVAIIFDWHIRWALDDIKGLLQKKNNYEQTVMEHYGVFWKRGIPVDVIDSTRSLEGYDLVIAPMLYMLRPGVAESIEAFVKQGGAFAATYATGYVNETDLTFLGGFPGPLKEILGIWCEEIDALYPGETNAIKWKGKSYKAYDLCELIHSRGAEALGEYGADFYAGQPALTVNTYGKGKAYFIAARTSEDFLDDFYGTLIAEKNIRSALKAKLPQGVTAQVRTNGKTNFIFVMNFTPGKVTVDTGSEGKKDLAPYEVLVVEDPVSNKAL